MDVSVAQGNPEVGFLQFGYVDGKEGLFKGGKMNGTKDDKHKLEDHLEMWRHYDSLRQAKNSGFTTANTVLVAITAILLQEATGLIVVVAILGIVVSASWFLLLDRNAAYIEYHRTIAGNGNEFFWMPEKLRSGLRSKLLTEVPSGAFFLFWVGVLVWSLTAVLPGS